MMRGLGASSLVVLLLVLMAVACGPEPSAATATPEPHTPMAMPPAATPLLPTPTSVPPTPTPEPPTPTAVPSTPTQTAVPPTATAVAAGPPQQRIAYSAADGEIYLINADGSGSARLTNSPGSDATPAFSADGQRIAFSSERDGNMEIYVMNADGSGAIRLTDNPAKDAFPVWSPDGERIAFTSVLDGDSEVFVMNADGSEDTNLTNSAGFDGHPAWSPDGKSIAFLSDRGGEFQWYFMAADGSAVEPRFLVNLPEEYLDLIGFFGGRWSPDGEFFAYTTVETFPFVHAEPMPLIRVEGLHGGACHFYWLLSMSPVWSPDGMALAFHTFYQGDNLDVGVVPLFREGDCYYVMTELSLDVRITSDAGPDVAGSWTDRCPPAPNS